MVRQMLPYCVHTFFVISALIGHAFSFGDCENTDTFECPSASINDEAGSLSLLQHTASLKKAQSNIKSIDADTELAIEKNADANSWPKAPFKAMPSPFKPIPGEIVVTPPLAYRITLAILAALVLCTFIGFFATEKKSKKQDTRPLAQTISCDPYIKRTELVLQDFLEKMTDDQLDRDFIVPIDKRGRVTYRRLKTFIASRDADLSRFGVHGNDRIATILGDGPEAAVAFWAFSAQCQFCPVNHKATNEEIDFLLNDLTDTKSGFSMKAVVLYKQDFDRVRGFNLIQCVKDARFGGLFSLSGKEDQVEKVPRQTEDIALVIQTSGTTKKPKMVPLTHDNLILCAETIVEMIGLHREDRSLNFLPLFHIGGIANNVIAPVLSGSSVITAEDFTGPAAFGWVVQYEPTWYYGSPTTHILMMRDHEPPKGHRLRLIRNATAALLPSVAEEMDNFWNCEILPGYGMSECTPIASHHIGCKVKLDCVGPATGPPVRIARFDEETRSLEDVPEKASGEICIRGPAVFNGYEVREHMHGENPNDDAFIEDPNTKLRWFRTGDNGMVDQETKYYKITGRAKEIIIRGGENISPFEVEDQVQDPRVTEKAVFAIDHNQLGEVVALAVVTDLPGEDMFALLKSIKKSANLHVSKKPEIIVKVDAFPKNNMRKIKRMELQKEVQKLLKPRDLHSDDPSAFYFKKGDGRPNQLIEYEDDEPDENDHYEEAEEIDSLGLTKGKGGVQINPDTKNVIMCMYAMAAFGVVAYHGQIFLLYPSGVSQFGLTLIHMMCGNVIGGMRWTMQCFVCCASFLQCKEPFSSQRAIILCILYFAYVWPIAPIITFFAELCSTEPVEAWYVMTDKRWFVGIMIFSYCAFACMRQDEVKKYIPPSVQCAFWAFLTLCLNIWPVNNSVVTAVAPTWFNFWFQDTIVCGLFVWVGCIMMYFFVGYYGHDIVDRVLAHPLAHDHAFQNGLVKSAPVIYLGFLFVQFYGPQQTIGIDLERSGYSWKWDPVTVILDQIVAIGMIVILSQATRIFSGRVKDVVAFVGTCSLGIYLGGDIIFYCPYTQVDKLGASFGIIIDKYEVLPTLQRMVYWTAGFWPAMVLMVFLYTLFQIFVFGVPFHRMYLACVNLGDFLTKYYSKKFQTDRRAATNARDSAKKP